MKANQEQLFDQEIKEKVENADVFAKKMPDKLTEDNLSKMDQKSHKSAGKSIKSGKKCAKPAWATT